jgi:hypothetical protein
VTRGAGGELGFIHQVIAEVSSAACMKSAENAAGRAGAVPKVMETLEVRLATMRVSPVKRLIVSRLIIVIIVN